MSATIDISIIIPTRNRAFLLAQCLQALSLQTIDRSRFEVIVVLDGPDPESREVAARSGEWLSMVLLEAPRLGISHAKNLALSKARGRLVLLINDDIVPGNMFVQSHLEAHDDVHPDQPTMILGYSPFLAPEADTLFDRLIRETSLIFFYDQMIETGGMVRRPRHHDWGYRHAWNLNLSLPRAAAVSVGGFRPAIANCCYEDVEFAWRMVQKFQSPVLFRPEAVAPHDHRYTPTGYLDREFRLGYSAYGFALAAGEAAKAVFGRDLTDPRELEYARLFIEREGTQESRLLEHFQRLAEIPATSISGKHASSLLHLIHGQHLLLKRLAFRRGLIAAAEGAEIQGLFAYSAGLSAEPGLTPDRETRPARARK